MVFATGFPTTWTKSVQRMRVLKGITPVITDGIARTQAFEGGIVVTTRPIRWVRKLIRELRKLICGMRKLICGMRNLICGMRKPNREERRCI